jgi:hypothetical protein
MPRKSKKSGNVTVNITVNSERKKKPRKKRAPRKKRGAQYIDYTGPHTIYGDRPLPARTIEVNVPYQLQSGSRLATGEIAVPLLQNAPMRDMIMNAPRRQDYPAIFDDNRSQASSRSSSSYMKPNYREELNTVSSSQQENASIASMEDPHLRDALDDLAIEEAVIEEHTSPSLLSRISSGIKSAAVSGGLEVGANALIGAASAAGATVGINPIATTTVLQTAKEGAKGLYRNYKLKKEVQFAVDTAKAEDELFNVPLRSDKTTAARYASTFKMEPEELQSQLRDFQRKHKGASLGDFKYALTGEVPP